MGLEEYRGKRRFDRTPEPAGEAEQSGDGTPGGPERSGRSAPEGAEGGLFVVHEHAARRLHYDLRLELDGVMKSWAVPKGPSLDPAEKRLAVHVEDHPIEYAAFEGVIPPGEYGAGTVVLWDRGVWKGVEAAAADPRAAYESGKLKFRLEGEKLRGRWMLVRLRPRPDEDDKADNWLFFKERDDEARAGDEAEVVRTRPGSVASGRSLRQVTEDADSLWHSGERDGGSPAVRGGSRAGGAPGAPPFAGAIEAPPLDPASIPGARPGELPGLVAPQLATLAAAAPFGRRLAARDQGRRVPAPLPGGPG